jgi:membrane-bound lytic murein transglycosylase D
MRSGRYMPVIEEILEENDLPLDLAYLAMTESGFNEKAYSRDHCSGLWQFAYSTGRMYGLKRTQWYDQRRDQKSFHRRVCKTSERKIFNSRNR